MPQQQNIAIVLCLLQLFIRTILPGTLSLPVLLSDRRCLGHHLGLIMLGFHSIIRPFYPFDLRTCSAQFIFSYFLRFQLYCLHRKYVPIFHCSLFPSLFFFIIKIFYDTFLTKDNLAFFLQFFRGLNVTRTSLTRTCIMLFLSFLILISVKIVALIQCNVCLLRWTIVSPLHGY